MAKNNPKPSKAAPVYISVISPAPLRGGTFKDPSNPGDDLRHGPIPVKSTPDMTIRRPFSFPTKPTLHRNEGLSMDQFNQPGHEDSVGEDKN